MTRRPLLAALSVGLATALGFAAGYGSEAAANAPSSSLAPGAQQPVVSPAAHYDTSPPLSSIPPSQTPGHSHPSKKFGGGHPSGGPPAADTSGHSLTPAIPSTSSNFDGVGNGFSGPQGTFTVNSAPSDSNLSVGPNHIVEIVNSDFAIFNKSGTVIYGPVQINTLWSGFGGGCQTNNDGDPTVKYDPIADRWVVSQFSVTTTPYLQCVAVSTSPDPTGSYNRYSFQYSDFPDYPKLSVWPDAYYTTFNMFAGGTTFSGGWVCAYDRTKMLSGAAATQQCFNLGTSYGGLLPSDIDGSQQPPAGAPNYIVALGAAASQLAYWKFHTDWTTPANTTLTGPATLSTAAFTQACSGGTCIPQTGTGQQLDSLADRLMYRLAYRNFGDHEALVVNHSITAGSSVGVRWYELRVAGSSLTINQQGTYAPDSNYRWMGSIAMDHSGDMGLGFSLSGSSLHPEIHYAGRLPSDPAGTMPQGEGTIINGGGSQSGQHLSRWGDYTAMAVDPSDDCTFWYVNQYIPSNGAFNWKTRIGSFKFTGCGAPPPANDFSISANPGAVSATQGSSSGPSTVSTAVTNGSAQSVTLSASGLPSGAAANFSANPITSGGSSTLTISTAPTTPTGSYVVTVTGTGTPSTTTHSTTVTLTVNCPAAASGGIGNGGFETGDFSCWTRAGTTSIVTSSIGVHSGTYAAMVGSTSPTSGDSSISQTFTAPSGSSPLTFWYKIVCPDTITYDWATATLQDNTSSSSSTLLSKTCSNSGTWVHSSPAAITAGHSYTLTLLSHDDNYPADPTYTLFDDVSLPVSAPANDFSISATSPVNVNQGSTGASTVTTTLTSGSAQTVTLSTSPLPSGVTASFSANPITSSGGSSTLTFTATATATTGSSTVTITGTGPSATHTTTVTLTVTASDFSISATSPVTVTQGSTGTSTVSTTLTSGSAQSVSLSTGALPSGVTASFNPASVTAGGSNSTLTFTASATATTGTTTVTVTGTGSSVTHSTTVSLTVTAGPSDFSISATSPVTVNQGSTATSTVSTTLTSGAAQSVSLSATGLPSGVTASFNPASVTAGGSNSTLTFTASWTATTGGPVTVTVTGTGSSATHSTTVALTVNPSDFSISATSPVTVNQGSTATSTVSTALTSGAAQSVSLSATGLPSGVTASFNPASVTAGGGSSTLTFTASSTAATGTVTVTVTGTGPAATHSTTVSLTVNAAPSGGIVNGGFETGNFSGWTPSGASTSVVNSGAHSGTYAARLGSTSATNGDSSIAQTFTASGGSGTLSFWYKETCPDSLTYDWATATLLDNTTATTSTILAKICTTNTWTQVTTSVTAGDSYTLTLTSHDDNFSSDPTYTLFDDVTLGAPPPPPPPPSGITTGGFETGSLSGWTPAGASTSVVNSGAHSGTNAARLGSTSATSGDSSIAQTFTVPSGNTTLSFYYQETCPDTITYDWATATLRDNTTATTSTILAKICTTNSWTVVNAGVTAGHSYTLTLISHDDNYGADPTYTLFDDVTLF